MVIKKFKKSKLETTVQFLKRFARRFEWFRTQENDFIAEDFNEAVLRIQERNAQIVWDAYYFPKAIKAILKEENYLPDERNAELRAKNMMVADIESGVLNELYRFTISE